MADSEMRGQLCDAPLQPSEPVLRCMVVKCVEETSNEYPLARDWLKEIAGGCSICTFIMDTIQNSYWIMEHVKDPNNRFSIHKCSWNPTLFQVWGQTDLESSGTNRGEVIRNRRNNTIFDIFCKRDGEVPVGLTPQSRDIFEDPKSDKFFAMLELWLQDCTGLRPQSSLPHDKCAQNTYVPLPKRVIDVGSDAERIFLYSSHDVQGKYATLSYCWGREGVFTTTVTTLREREAGMEYSSLPLTFQDAVTVTRELGIKYLWIDSICILQDSDEDWKAESAKMGAYYKNSYVTISALDSRSSNDGFLHPRTPESSIPWPNSRGCYLREAKVSTQNLLEAALLQGRAWVYQERLMSTRIIHFGKDEILWECMTCERRESSTIIEHDEVLTTQVLNYKESENALDRNKRLLSLLPPWATSLDLWYHLINDYSRKKLTYMSDKVPATLGLVDEIQRSAINYTFCSRTGVWKEDLGRGLSWKAGPDAVPNNSRVPDYPSWSWASVPGPVAYATGIKYTKGPGHQIQEAIPKFAGKSIQLSGSEIILETKSRLVHLEEHGETLFGKERISRPKTSKTVTMYDEKGRTEWNRDQIGEATMDLDVDLETYGLCLALSIGSVDTFPHGDRVFNLYVLLVRLSSREVGKWVRVGIGHMPSSTTWGEKYHKFFDDCDTKTFILQ